MSSEYPKLHHEKLDVYAAAIEFLAIAVRLIEGFPRGNSSVAEQLRRASLSIPLYAQLIDRPREREGPYAITAAHVSRSFTDCRQP